MCSIKYHVPLKDSSLSGTLIKTTLVDFPGRVATTYFISGCNIRCPYCYNGELVFNTLPQEDSTSIQELFSHLEKRKNVLTGFVFSGGEPLIHTETPEIISFAKSLGYKVKLDTNGLLPDRLEKLFEKEETTPDYIAVDLKTNPDNYSLLKYSGDAKENLIKTISILEKNNVDHEFRTVLCPPLIGKLDIEAITKLIQKESKWFFANFRNDNCLDESYNDVMPYTDKEITELVEYAKSFVVNAVLR